MSSFLRCPQMRDHNIYARPHIIHLDSKKPTPAPPPPSSSSAALRPGAPPHFLGLPTIQDHEHVFLPYDVSASSGDEDRDEDGADEERTIRVQVNIIAGDAPHTIPSKAVRVLGIERAKKSAPGKTMGWGRCGRRRKRR